MKYQLVGMPGRVCDFDLDWTGEEPICEGLRKCLNNMMEKKGKKRELQIGDICKL